MSKIKYYAQGRGGYEAKAEHCTKITANLTLQHNSAVPDIIRYVHIHNQHEKLCKYSKYYTMQSSIWLPHFPGEGRASEIIDIIAAEHAEIYVDSYGY